MHYVYITKIMPFVANDKCFVYMLRNAIVISQSINISWAISDVLRVRSDCDAGLYRFGV